VPRAGAITASFGRGALRLAASIASPALFRLSTGRWPDRAETTRFAAAFCDGDMHIPPILRSLVVTPAAREQISRMVCFHLIAEGMLPKPSVGGIPPLMGNAMQCWNGPSVSFLHFERTGGTSLAAALTDRFHPLQIAAAHRAEDIDNPKVAIEERKLVWGHYDLPTLRRLSPERRIITVLREPAARILSLYYFWRSIHPSQLDERADSRVMEAQRLNLLDFLQSDHQSLRDSIDNIYARRLAGLYGSGTPDDPLERDPDGALALARNALEHFAFVGISEHMADAFRGIEHALGVNLSASQRLNDAAVNPKNQPWLFRRVEHEVKTPEILAALAHLTRLDSVLYRTCLKEAVLF
jgi:hypothetical protein